MSLEAMSQTGSENDERGSRTTGQKDPSRRTILRSIATLGAAAVPGGAALTYFQQRSEYVQLYSTTVVMTGRESRTLLVKASEHFAVPGTRIHREAADHRLLRAREARILEHCSSAIMESEWYGLYRDALLDVHVLSASLPAPVAAWSPRWRYVWPRDASHVAVALARIGLVQESMRTLSFLARQQRLDGWFEARYLPNGSGVPDDRTKQLDGLGWFVWGVAEVGRALNGRGDDMVKQLDQQTKTAVNRAVHAMLRATDTPSRLPSPSPDYWEVAEDRLTLGTAAPVLSGLQHGCLLLDKLGEPRLAHRARRRAEQVAESVRQSFGTSGYRRYQRGGDYDTALTFLLPPYAAAVDTVISGHLQVAQERMLRPAGGVAPGEGWKKDGISWTPETALFAQAYAAIGDEGRASDLLRWLSGHRTALGSFPEKVLWDGQPAAVAPLAWTAALVILTIESLSREAARPNANSSTGEDVRAPG